ncbi:MAG: zinc ribbon domain-containing protein [Deltaproteobacteria bacterium]|nr:zinc ribbon domain-containing protein [Deltaproteobacteria bacterium]
MPMYDFKCPDCGLEFEELVRSATDSDGLLCPECGSGQVRREISAPCVMSGSGGSSSFTGSPSGGCSSSSPFT